ncbi:hypothetical protein PoB_007328100 [Plakobranchus ocellatus]|uniref:Uncharacterized protein n=1 Tax=Plakobranchus ocellatus TaxID=259542 RepID=A0AAV4DRN0_9GAST|nr:hypothetical protein PoB_007328100 [Plakobranchus ocellatus]
MWKRLQIRMSHKLQSTEKRRYFFNGFWELSDTQRQWDFLVTCVTEFEAKRTSHAEKSSSRRQKSKKWALLLDVNNVAVCKTFFLDTLNITSTGDNNDRGTSVRYQLHIRRHERKPSHETYQELNRERCNESSH